MSNFFINSNLTKNFSELRKASKTKGITISYGSSWLIEKTIDSLIRILIGIRDDIEGGSKFPNHVADSDIVIMYRDPKTGIGEPVSKRMWREVENERKKASENDQKR